MHEGWHPLTVDEFEELLRKHPPLRWPFTSVVITCDDDSVSAGFHGGDSEKGCPECESAGIDSALPPSVA